MYGVLPVMVQGTVACASYYVRCVTLLRVFPSTLLGEWVGKEHILNRRRYKLVVVK